MKQTNNDSKIIRSKRESERRKQSVTRRCSEGCQDERASRNTSSKAMMLTMWRRRRSTITQGRKQEIWGNRKARNLRLEHSTARSRLRRRRRAQVHVHDGRGVDGDKYNQCENHVHAGVNHMGVRGKPQRNRNCRVEKQGAKLSSLRCSSTEPGRSKREIVEYNRSCDKPRWSLLREAGARQQPKEKAGAKTSRKQRT